MDDVEAFHALGRASGRHRRVKPIGELTDAEREELRAALSASIDAAQQPWDGEPSEDETEARP